MPLPETAQTLAPMEDTPLWTLPRAVPGWALAGRGCLYPGGDTDPKEGLAALALYRGGLGCVIGWEGLPPGSGLEGS